MSYYNNFEDLINDFFGIPKKKTSEETFNEWLKVFLEELQKNIKTEKKAEEKPEKVKAEKIPESSVVVKSNTAPAIESVADLIQKDLEKIRETLKINKYRDEALSKQVKALADKVTNFEEDMKKINACSHCDADLIADLYSKLYEVAEACEENDIGSFEFLDKPFETLLEDADNEEESEEVEIEPEDFLDTLYEDDEDDSSEDEAIKTYALDHFGLEGYTIGDGESAALIIPLDDKFNLDRFVANEAMKKFKV